jgi:hypothetical protein
MCTARHQPTQVYKPSVTNENAQFCPVIACDTTQGRKALSWLTVKLPALTEKAERFHTCQVIELIYLKTKQI